MYFVKNSQIEGKFRPDMLHMYVKTTTEKLLCAQQIFNFPNNTDDDQELSIIFETEFEFYKFKDLVEQVVKEMGSEKLNTYVNGTAVWLIGHDFIKCSKCHNKMDRYRVDPYIKEFKYCPFCLATIIDIICYPIE